MKIILINLDILNKKIKKIMKMNLVILRRKMIKKIKKQVIKKMIGVTLMMIIICNKLIVIYKKIRMIKVMRFNQKMKQKLSPYTKIKNRFQKKIKILKKKAIGEILTKQIQLNKIKITKRAKAKMNKKKQKSLWKKMMIKPKVILVILQKKHRNKNPIKKMQATVILEIFQKNKQQKHQQYKKNRKYKYRSQIHLKYNRLR